MENRPQRMDIARRMVAHMTTRGWREAPHACYLYEPDATEFFDEYRALAEQKAAQGVRITITAALLKVIAQGLSAAPTLNAHFAYNRACETGSLQKMTAVDVTLPTLLGDGRMIPPIVFGVQALSIDGISRRMEQIGEKIQRTNIDELLYRTAYQEMIERLLRFDLSALPRIVAGTMGKNRVPHLTGAKKREYERTPASGRLGVRDLRYGTVTVSNVGSLYRGQQGFVTLMDVIPPQVFAVGLGAAQEKPGVVTGADNKKAVAARTYLPMCLAFDHRALDFDDLVPFLNRLDEIFQNPKVIWEWAD